MREKMAGILNVTVDYTKESGGSALSVQQFSEALGSQIVSLTRPLSLSASGSYSDGCIHIPVDDGFVGNAYSYLSKRNAQQLRELIRNASLVICHKLFRHHNQLILEECVANDIPYIVVPHGGLDPYVFTYSNARKRAWFALFGNRFFRNARAVIYATPKEMAKASNKVSPARGQVISWYVREPQNIDRNTFRELVWSRYGLMRGNRLYLMLGRLHSMKRIFEAIRGFKAAELPNAALLIAGPEDEYTVKQVSSYAKNIGAINVFIIGSVYGSEKEELLAASDFSLNTSYRENYCYSIVEGMSYGAPAVLTPGNDLASTLEQEGCAICCADYDDGSLVQALRRSATMEQSDTAAMRNRARGWVRNNATYEAFQHNLLHLVNDIMDCSIYTGTVG
jgi:glycosyltransferase involved in cell wall biosynthesis